MSLHLDFTPHSWYMGFAIQKTNIAKNDIRNYPFNAYIDDGNTYRVDEVHGHTMTEIKAAIREYHLCKHNGYGERIAKHELKYLRGELRAERTSYSELARLFKLHEYIEDGDVELLEAAGVPERSR